MADFRRFLDALVRHTRALRLRIHGAQLSPADYLGAQIACRPGFRSGKGRIKIGPHSRIHHGVVLDAFGGHIVVGAHVFLGPHTVIYGHGGVEIGDECLIAMHCRILSSNHAVAPFDTPIRSQPDVLRPSKIGRDVWLGAGVTILGGVSVGDGCIIGAGAVVTKDLSPGAIAYGTPAEVKGFREGAPR